jgi:hypothetical protein
MVQSQDSDYLPETDQNLLLPGAEHFSIFYKMPRSLASKPHYYNRGDTALKNIAKKSHTRNLEPSDRIGSD